MHRPTLHDHPIACLFMIPKKYMARILIASLQNWTKCFTPTNDSCIFCIKCGWKQVHVQRSPPPPIPPPGGRRKRWASYKRNVVEGQIRVKFRNRVSGSASNSWDGPDGIVVAHPFIIHIRMGTMDERPYGFWLNQIKGTIYSTKKINLPPPPSVYMLADIYRKWACYGLAALFTWPNPHFLDRYYTFNILLQ